MKIRCKNCYRVLNNDEEWCTRCGAHSEEVEKYLKEGIVPIDEADISKKSFIIYFFFAFILNGILDIIFGMAYNAMHQQNLGEVGQSLPYSITYYSSINALLVTSILTFTLMLVMNFRDIKKYILFSLNQRTIISLSIGIVVVIGIVFLSKYTLFTVTPNYFKEYLMNPTLDMQVKGSINVFKIIVVLVFYCLTEELIFRKAFMNYLDQTTLMKDISIIIIDAFVSTILMVSCFLLLVKATLIEYLFFILSNLIINGLLAFNYFYNKRSIIPNIILRLLFIILFIIILII